MKANLIRALKNNTELVDIEPGRSARRNFPDINFDNAVLIINGRIAEPDTIIQELDVVTLRLLPGDLTETPWWVATFFIPFGFLIQPAELAYKAKKIAEEAEEQLDNLKKLTNADIDNAPFLRGASNTIATGKSQPYLCGRNFLTPYLFSKPRYEIPYYDNGAHQYIYMIFEAGFKDIIFNKIGIGDVTLKEFNDDEPQNGVYEIADSVFAEHGLIEIRQDGAPFTTLSVLNMKCVSNVVNKLIPKHGFLDPSAPDEYINFTLDPYARSVTCCVSFPYGLYQYDSDYKKKETTVEVVFEYSLDGGETWTPFYLTDGYPVDRQYRYITKKSTKEMRFTAVKNFTYNDYVTLHENGQSAIFMRVVNRCFTANEVKNDAYLYYYQTVSFDPLKSSAPAGVIEDNGAVGLVNCLNVENRERAKSCVIGIRLYATKDNADKLKQFNFIATSTARTWDSEEQAWSETKAATRNPAAIALEILTSDTHPASRYDDSEIDLDAFGALYEYCETNNIYFDYVITQNQKKDSTLQLIADVCGCAFYKDIYGRRSVSIDQAQENAVAVYNPQNVISLTNKKTFARRVDALRVKYIDSINDTFKENTYTVTRLENGQPVTIDENSIIKEITATGITRFAQVVKYARRLMAIDELRPITTQLRIGAEGVYFTPYAKIAIQDPSLNGDARDAIIKSVVYSLGYLSKIVLDRPVTFDPLKTYGVIINTVNDAGAVPLALRVSGTGTTDELLIEDEYVATETAQPEPGNPLAFGELDENDGFTMIAHEYVITRVARTEGGFNLDLQEYNEAIYEPGVIPAYKPLVNNTPTPDTETIPPNTVSPEDIENIAAGIDAGAIQEAVDTIQNGYRFTNVFKLRPVEDTLEEIIAKIDEETRNRSASISISEDEILLQVQDMERELVGLIDIQAGSVTALVEGGGAAGQMSLTLNLPIMIDATKRQQLIAASTEAKVNAVYGLVENTAYYGIKGNASSAAVKALWDDAVAAGLIASQIDLTATQISINAENVKIDGETIINNASKIKAELIDVEELLASSVTVKDKGVIKSANYNGTIDSDGNITAYGSAGWAIDHAGKSDFVDLNAEGGLFKDITIQNGARYATLIGGQSLTDFKQNLVAHFSQCKVRPTAYNAYPAAGQVTFSDLTEGYYKFNITDAELSWNSSGDLTAIVFRGSGYVIRAPQERYPTKLQYNVRNDELRLFYEYLNNTSIVGDSILITNIMWQVAIAYV